MSTETGTAATITSTPGNGTRYFIVYGADFVALPDFGVAATMNPHPVEWTYVATKLGLTEPDAKAVFAALNPEPIKVSIEALRYLTNLVDVDAGENAPSDEVLTEVEHALGMDKS